MPSSSGVSTTPGATTLAAAQVVFAGDPGLRRLSQPEVSAGATERLSAGPGGLEESSLGARSIRAYDIAVAASGRSLAPTISSHSMMTSSAMNTGWKYRNRALV